MHKLRKESPTKGFGAQRTGRLMQFIGPLVFLGLLAAAHASTACQMTVPACPNYPQYTGTFYDNFQDPGYPDTSNVDQAECMQRAQDYYSWCGTSTPVTASFLIDGTSVQTTTYPVTACQMTVPACPNYPQYTGTFYDSFQDPGYPDTSNVDQAECMQRAQDYYSWCGTSTPVTASFLQNGAVVQSATYPSNAQGSGGGQQAQIQLPCDVAKSGNTPCVAAYSMARALFSTYTGPLFTVSNGYSTLDAQTTATGVVNLAPIINFCPPLACTVVKIYDQTSNHLDAINQVQYAGSNAPQPTTAPTFTTMQVGSATVPAAIDGSLEAGSRANSSWSNANMPTGPSAVTEYAVGGPDLSTHGESVWDFGEAEQYVVDTGPNHMFAIDLGAQAPFLFLDLEGGGILDKSMPAIYTPGVILAKTDGVSVFTEKYAAVGGGLAPVADTPSNPLSLANCTGILQYYGLPLNCFGYGPMALEGGLTLGAGGDGSTLSGQGFFIEGAVMSGQTGDNQDDTIMQSINTMGS
jgi:hypothetical protein